MKHVGFFIAFFMFANGYCYDLHDETLQFMRINNYDDELILRAKKMNSLFMKKTYREVNNICTFKNFDSESVRNHYDPIVLYNVASFYLLRMSFITEDMDSASKARVEKSAKNSEIPEQKIGSLKKSLSELSEKTIIFYSKNNISTEKFIYLLLLFPLLQPIACGFVNENWRPDTIIDYFLEETSSPGLEGWLAIIDPLVFNYLLLVCDIDGDDFSKSTLMTSLNNAMVIGDTNGLMSESSLVKMSDHIWKYILLRSIDDNIKISKWLSQNFKSAFPKMITCQDEHEFFNWLKGTGIENIEWDSPYEQSPLRRTTKDIKHCTLDVQSKRILKRIQRIKESFPYKKDNIEFLMLKERYRIIIEKIKENMDTKS